MNSLQKKLVALGLSGAAVIAGVKLIAPSEGLVLHPYIDDVGVKTLCYGQTGIKIKDKIYTEDECAILLAEEIITIEEKITPLIKVKLNSYQKAAMIDFTYNKGFEAFKNSTMLGKLNAGNTRGACEELTKWVFAGQCKEGQRDCVKTINGTWKFKFKGLVKRQELERQYCLGEIPYDPNIENKDARHSP